MCLLTCVCVCACVGVCVCRIVQEQCCVTVLEDSMCTTGINMAKERSSCYTDQFSNSCDSKTTKVCVSVCVSVCVCSSSLPLSLCMSVCVSVGPSACMFVSFWFNLGVG